MPDMKFDGPPSLTHALGPLVLLVGGLLASVGAGLWQQRANEAQVDAQLELTAERTAERLRRRMLTYENGLLATRSAIVTAGRAVQEITREQFHRYGLSLELERHLPGVSGVSFIRRVPAAQEAVFVAAMRDEGFQDFRIRQLEPNLGERFVIQYMEPLQGNNLQALGLDIASDPARRDAALDSLRSGLPRLSAPFALEDDASRSLRAFALMVPIYRGITTPAPEQRDAQAIGWANVRLVMDEVLQDFERENGAFALALADATPPGAPLPFFSSPDWSPAATGAQRSQVPLQLYGRTWQVQVQALAPLVQRLRLRDPLDLTLRSAAVAALLALLLHAVLRSAQRQHEIQRQRARMAAVVHSAHDAIVGHSPRHLVCSWNPAAERLLGWREAEVLGRDLLALTVPPEAREQARAALRRVMDGEDVPPFDTVRLDRHGARVDVSVSVAGVRDAQGRLESVATTLRDMRTQRAAQARIEELNTTLEQQVRQRTAELRAILDSAASAIVATDMEGHVISFNPAAQALLRLDAAQAQGRSMLEFHDPDELRERLHLLPAELQAQARRLAGGAPRAVPPARPAYEGERSEWTYVRADGTRFPGLLSLSALRDGQGQPQGFLGVIVDLSERKALEQALEQRTLQAEAASQAKSAFLAHMSHEFHTPLNAVLGFSQLLAQMALPNRAQVFVEHIRQAGEHLLGLTDDVLDLSRLEAGALRLEHAPFELPALLDEVYARVLPPAAHKGLALRVEIAPELPRRLRGDATRLKQVLLKLLGNAVKFTERGGVTLRVAVAAREPGRVRLRMEVSDTGLGIEPQARQRIFEAFAQGDDSTTRRFGGTGSGLPIVRHLVALMGGELTLQSEPGRGSTFGVSVAMEVDEGDGGAAGA
jgi:PAS domain S-box-containing protein